jgi:hypothetical protein
MFLIALAGSAFAKYSKAAASANSTIMYYNDGFGSCEYTTIIDANCVPEPLSYICYEDTHDVGWQIMFQHEAGFTCYQPFYSYYPNY